MIQPSIKSNSLEELDIINRLAKGEPQHSIAKDYNTQQSRISTLKSINKHKVEEAKQKLLRLIPDIVDTVQTDINTNQRLSKHIALDFTQTTSEQISLKNTLDKTNVNLLRVAGIIQSQALINYNQYNQDNSKTVVIEPAVLNMFANHAKELVDNGDVVSIEPENGECTP